MNFIEPLFTISRRYLMDVRCDFTKIFARHSGGRSILFSSCALCQYISTKSDKAAVQFSSHAASVVTERRGKIFLVGINRPEKRNCVNAAAAQELLKAWRAFENDDSLTAAVLHGIGGHFCGGYDLQELATTTTEDVEQLNSIFSFVHPSNVLQVTKPAIAAISGYAVAGGTELALLCDLRVMEETAIMGIFCRKLGIPMLYGGTVRLPQLIGLSRALDMILTGRPVGAKEALEFGLANRVVPCGTALEHAINLATSISEFPQESVRTDRRATYYAMYEAKSLQDALQFEYNNGLPIVTKEAIPGAQRFVSGGGKR